jgi:hypothetical protein
MRADHFHPPTLSMHASNVPPAVEQSGAVYRQSSTKSANLRRA